MRGERSPTDSHPHPPGTPPSLDSLTTVAYTNIVEQLFAHDPEGAVLAFADMMKKGITMPAHYMDDGWHSSGEGANPGQNLFVDYATVADAVGVYTTGDYADIVQHLVSCRSCEGSLLIVADFFRCVT